jgi:hypothetical protein
MFFNNSLRLRRPSVRRGCRWQQAGEVSIMSQRSRLLQVGVTVQRLTPNISLNPDASPAALTRRPLGAG